MKNHRPKSFPAHISLTRAARQVPYLPPDCNPILYCPFEEALIRSGAIKRQKPNRFNERILRLAENIYPNNSTRHENCLKKIEFVPKTKGYVWSDRNENIVCCRRPGEISKKVKMRFEELKKLKKEEEEALLAMRLKKEKKMERQKELLLIKQKSDSKEVNTPVIEPEEIKAVHEQCQKKVAGKDGKVTKKLNAEDFRCPISRENNTKAGSDVAGKKKKSGSELKGKKKKGKGK